MERKREREEGSYTARKKRMAVFRNVLERERERVLERERETEVLGSKQDQIIDQKNTKYYTCLLQSTIVTASIKQASGIVAATVISG